MQMMEVRFTSGGRDGNVWTDWIPDHEIEATRQELNAANRAWWDSGPGFCQPGTTMEVLGTVSVERQLAEIESQTL